jgi:hypothetical protein
MLVTVGRTVVVVGVGVAVVVVAVVVIAVVVVAVAEAAATMIYPVWVAVLLPAEFVAVNITVYVPAIA